jgi:hypothetical protein
VAYLGAKLPSFRDAHEALNVLLKVSVGLKRVERITERIGGERVAERESEIEAWSRLPLVERDQAPPGVKPPEVAAALADGGRMQLCEKEEDATSHWVEYKAGVLHGLSSQEHPCDPHPSVPEVYLQRDRIDKITREITQVAAVVESPRSPGGNEEALDLMLPRVPAEDRSLSGYEPPKVIDRDVVASRSDSRHFGRHLAARAWQLGLFAAKRKAWIGDGQNWLWTEWERYFKPFGFVPILDFIHALTAVDHLDLAGRCVAGDQGTGGPTAGTRRADRRRWRNQPTATGGQHVDLPSKPEGTHAVSGLSPTRPPHHLGPHGVNGQATESSHQRQREVLVRAGR